MASHRVSPGLYLQILVHETSADILYSHRVAATIYHLFLSEDNSPELYAQFKRIHSLVPYKALKNVIRIANPAAVMKGVLDLFLAQPFGARSLMQHIFALALGDGVRSTQRSIDALSEKIKDPSLCNKLKQFTEADENTKNALRSEAENEQVELLIVISRTPELQPELESEQVGRIFNAYVAWTNAVENVRLCFVRSPELLAYIVPRSIRRCSKELSSLRISNKCSSFTPDNETSK